MPDSTEIKTDSSFTDNNSRPPGELNGPTKPKPVGIKFVLAGILLLIVIGCLIYVGFSDPRDPR